MGKNRCQSMMFILLAIMAVYLATIISGSQKWANITSPAAAFVIGIIIWESSRNIKVFHLNWVLLALVALSWSLADTFWMIASNMYGLNPEKIPVFMYLYAIPNILLTLTAVIYFIKNIKKWHRVQLALNITVSCTASFIFLWQIILKDYDIFSISFDDFINTFIYLIADIIAVSIVVIMYLSSKANKLSRQMQMIVVGTCLYALSDLYYTYLVFKEAYVPNTLIDYMYMCAMAVFGMASIYEACRPYTISTRYWGMPENTWNVGQYLSLLIIPFFSI